MQEFPVTTAGYASLLSWLRSFGTLAVAGVEGTGSYGAGLARHLAAAGVRVVEVDRPDRQDRARQGKSDPLDAVSAARAALSGRASGAPRGRDGAVEAIQALMVAKRSARAERTQANGQARALIMTGPEELRARFVRRSPAQQRRTVQQRDHPLPEALRRARGLPPAPRRRLTPAASRGGRTLDPAAAPAGLRTIGRPPRDPLQPGLVTG